MQEHTERLVAVANNFVQATAVFAFLLVLGHEPAAPDDNRSLKKSVESAAWFDCNATL